MLGSKLGKIISLAVISILLVITFVPFTAEARLKSNWSRNYGGEFHDIAHEVLSTEDGGYLLAGYSNSFGPERRDQVFLVKTNSNGFTQWRKNIGGEYSDRGYAATNTDDGGYAIAGLTTSYGGRDNYDFYLVKTNSEGDVEFERNYGGEHNEIAYDVIQTSDGGYLLGGSTVTYGHRGRDWWIVRTDEDGEKLWSRYHGGNQDEVLTSIVENEDGNFVLGGYTASYADPGFGLWVLEIDEDEIDQGKEEEEVTEKQGVQLTEHLFSLDIAYEEYLKEGLMNETLRNTFEEKGHDIHENAELFFERDEREDEDRWFISGDLKKEYRIEIGEKLDVYSEKMVIWETNIGGTLDDKIHDLVMTQDGGYAAAGETRSYAEVGSNCWLVKLDTEGKEEWNVSFGGDYTEVAHSLTESHEGTLLMAGYETTWGGVQEDFFIVETDKEGEKLFQYDTGGERTDIAYSIITVDEDTFAVAGKTRSFGGGGFSFYLLELGRPTGVSTPLVLGALGVGAVGVYAGVKIIKKYRHKFRWF